MKTISSRVRIGLAISVLALGCLVSSLAFAAAPADGAHPQCSAEHGKHQSAAGRAEHAAERFKKADKNNDGFLTQDEVGEKRWQRMQVADANKDGKISQAELEAAHAEGKLGHKHNKQPA